MKNADKTLVAQIALEFNTYYVTDRFGITLDGQDYENAVIAWGIAEYVGNYGEVFEVGSFDIKLTQGERFTDNGYLFDPTDIWNNKTVTVKRWTSGDSSFSSDCEDFVKGQVKNFKNEGTSISFTIDVSNTKDDKLLPAILIEDQSGLAEAEYKCDVISSSGNLIVVTNYTIFSPDELIVLRNNAGDVEYAQIDAVNGVVTIALKHSVTNTYSLATGGTIEKAFINVPKNSVGKTVPIQIGDLSDTDSGIFGKAISVNEKIGKQAIVVDGVEQTAMSSIGTWNKSLETYHKARSEINEETTTSDTAASGQKIVEVFNTAPFMPGDKVEIIDGATSEVNIIDSIGNASTVQYYQLTMENNLSNTYSAASTVRYISGQYQIADNNNFVSFDIDSTTTLKNDMYTTNDIEKVYLVTDGAKKIKWETGDAGRSVNSREILYSSIIRIGNELMLVIEAPDTVNDTIYVERAYSNTNKENHSAGDKVYQSDKFIMKNALVYRHRFDAIATANHYHGTSQAGGCSTSIVNSTPDTYILNGTQKMLNGSMDDYFEYEQKSLISCSSTFSMTFYSFDLKFKVLEDNYPVFGMALATDARFEVYDIYPTDGTVSVHPGIYFWGINSGEYDTAPWYVPEVTYAYAPVGTNTDQTFLAIDTYDSISTNGILGMQLIDDGTTGVAISNLTDLNQRIRISLCCRIASTTYSKQAGLNVRIWRLGLWVDFMSDYTKSTVVSDIQGRKITADVNTITGGTTGNLCENPVDVLALLLTQELGYETTDFTSDWATVKTYFDTSGNFSEGDTPLVASSYGIGDKRKKGWELCSEIASHYNIAITKAYDGTIGIINLHEIYFNTPSGNEIAIEDIFFLPQTSQRRITIYQTGVSQIYNDYVIKWKRNNSTDEYQEAYKLPDSTGFEHSANSLAGARADYYGNQKRNMTIESPFIYNENDALRKAMWEANDKAEAHFWIEFYIDGDHYSEMQSPPLTEQYEVGDIIYLTGKHGGINFQSTNKFYIQNIRFHDAGRVVEINAKSLQPVTAFETTATTGANMIQDTGGDSWSGDTIQDSGGDSFAGDTIQDTGG